MSGSGDPFRDLDQEMTTLTRSFGAAGLMVAHKGGSRQTDPNRQSRRLRQTKAPTARQLRRMSQGQLTSYMWKTHTRGMNGQQVTGETSRISSELGRRGLVGQKQAWENLALVRQDHLNGQGEHLQAAQAELERQQSVQQVSAQQRQAEHQGAQAQANQQAPSMSADISSAMAAIAVGAAGAELLSTVVDERVEQLGVDTGADQGTDLESTAGQGADLAEEGAEPEAVESAEFGSQAVVGDLGQAMADEQTSPGAGAEATAETTQENQAEAAPAETAEPATAEA
ncbi:hypothetical protein ACT3SZ_14945 [Corynebacterium sp. AOP40-9SA-29]|uniref:hypothetical protein n=1 Tax=Corynebacterium sp. AOP40-9SA-29 TaxID=3457677 RepID=UPI004033C9B5